MHWVLLLCCYSSPLPSFRLVAVCHVHLACLPLNQFFCHVPPINKLNQRREPLPSMFWLVGVVFLSCIIHLPSGILILPCAGDHTSHSNSNCWFQCHHLFSYWYVFVFIAFVSSKLVSWSLINYFIHFPLPPIPTLLACYQFSSSCVCLSNWAYPYIFILYYVHYLLESGHRRVTAIIIFQFFLISIKGSHYPNPRSMPWDPCSLVTIPSKL